MHVTAIAFRQKETERLGLLALVTTHGQTEVDAIAPRLDLIIYAHRIRERILHQALRPEGSQLGAQGLQRGAARRRFDAQDLRPGLAARQRAFVDRGGGFEIPQRDARDASAGRQLTQQTSAVVQRIDGRPLKNDRFDSVDEGLTRGLGKGPLTRLIGAD